MELNFDRCYIWYCVTFGFVAFGVRLVKKKRDRARQTATESAGAHFSCIFYPGCPNSLLGLFKFFLATKKPGALCSKFFVA